MRPPIGSSREYIAIQRWYGERTAARSGVPLIRHIDEALVILARIDASDAAARAFCVHPLVQADSDLASNAARIAEATELARYFELWFARLAIDEARYRELVVGL